MTLAGAQFEDTTPEEIKEELIKNINQYFKELS